jgi:hypothetical protein
MEAYIAAPTMKEFHKADNFVRMLLGPIGSGKSVACCIEVLLRACKQPPNKEGIRRSRWAVIRNTYAELKDTTIRTFFEWIPQDLGYWNQQNTRFHAKFAPGDGTIIDLEILFRALDRPQDIRKLLSLELTGAWINEAREVAKAVLDMLMGRVGRFPSRREIDNYWHGVILDTNPCDVDHWIYKFFEEVRPESWQLFHQPSGLSDSAENRLNLPATYYENMMPGKTQEWINVYVHGKYGFVAEGNPVYPEFNDDIHVSKNIIEPVPTEPLYVGIDFGLTPAATINQHINGQWRVIDEVVTTRMGALNFGILLGEKLRNSYQGYAMEIYGDPAGNQSAQTDEQTPFMILQSQGIMAMPAPTNDFTIRREAIAKKLGMMTFGGEPAFLISPNARMFRKGMGGGYKFRRMQVVGEERYHDQPDKQSIYSHVCEADQYAACGAGQGAELLGYTKDWDKSVNRVQH